MLSIHYIRDIINSHRIDFESMTIVWTPYKVIFENDSIIITDWVESYTALIHQPLYEKIKSYHYEYEYQKNHRKICELLHQVESTKEYINIQWIVSDNRSIEYSRLVSLLKKYKNPTHQAFEDLQEINRHKDAIVSISTKYQKNLFSLFK